MIATSRIQRRYDHRSGLAEMSRFSPSRFDRCREQLPLQTIIRLIGLSRSRFHEWKQEHLCGLVDRSSCPKKSVHQITPKEIAVIRDMATSDEYRHVPTAVLARLAERLGKIFASASTWYRLTHIDGRRWNRKLQYFGRRNLRELSFTASRRRAIATDNCSGLSWSTQDRDTISDSKCGKPTTPPVNPRSQCSTTTAGRGLSPH